MPPVAARVVDVYAVPTEPAGSDAVVTLTVTSMVSVNAFCAVRGAVPGVESAI